MTDFLGHDTCRTIAQKMSKKIVKNIWKACLNRESALGIKPDILFPVKSIKLRFLSSAMLRGTTPCVEYDVMRVYVVWFLDDGGGGKEGNAVIVQSKTSTGQKIMAEVNQPQT